MLSVTSHRSLDLVGAAELGVRRRSHIMKAFLILFLAGSMLIAAEPTREGDLSVHMLPDRVAKIIGEHGGFTVTDPATKQRGTTYAHPAELLTYFQRLPPSVRQNGIWIVRYSSQLLFRERASQAKGFVCALHREKDFYLHLPCFRTAQELETPRMNSCSCYLDCNWLTCATESTCVGKLSASKEGTHAQRCHLRRLLMRFGALRGYRTALRRFPLPLFRLSTEQWRTVRDVGIVPSERLSVYCWTAERVAVGWPVAFLLSPLRHAVDFHG